MGRKRKKDRKIEKDFKKLHIGRKRKKDMKRKKE